MPVGDKTPLTPLAWQPVPGAPGITIFPFIRKLDVISSNSFLIRLPDAILAIDPGGLPEQARMLAEVISGIPGGRDLPVIAFLTHAHVDHFLGMLHEPFFADPARSVIAVQEAGATALAEQDSRLTQASVLGRGIAPLRVGLRLFCRQEPAISGNPDCIPIAGGMTATISYDVWSPGEDSSLDRACLSFGPDCRIEVYHTPGHSPDSICIRIGRLLFIGDLLFAANPGIAGLAGWDQEALLRSLNGVLALLDRGDTDLVCPGHGGVIQRETAQSMLAAARRDAQGLAGIAELDSERAVQTAAFAEDCMEQVNELFSVMAGRLWYVSYVMEDLGEPAIAGKAGSLIRGEMIDELLDAFHAFSIEHHAADQVPIHLALKAGQVIARLDRAFERDQLARIIDPTLVYRAEHVLSAYISMLRGFPPPAERVRCDLREALGVAVTNCSVPACSDDEVLSVSDDEESFLQMLLARIGTRPLLEDVAFAFRHGDDSPTALIDRGHFMDLVTYILEDLVGSGAGTVIMDLECTEDMAVVHITGTGMTARPSEAWRIRGFLHRLAALAGGSLTCDDPGGSRRFRFEVARAG